MTVAGSAAGRAQRKLSEITSGQIYGQTRLTYREISVIYAPPDLAVLDSDESSQ